MEKKKAKAKIKRKIKDSVFTSLFSSVEYTGMLYRDLTGRDAAGSRIEIVTLNNIFCNGIYNDLGFLVDGKELFLIEAQSTRCPNIEFRITSYFLDTIKRIVPSFNIRQYSSKIMDDIPQPFFYVVYTGKDPVPEYYDTTIDFFSGQHIQIRVKVLTKENTKGILRAYIVFTEIYEEYCSIYGRSREAVLKTIDYCMNNEETKVLRKYLSTHKVEVETMFEDMYSQEAVTRDWGEYQRAEGIVEGEARGVAKGRAEGEENLRKALREHAKKLGLSKETQKYLYGNILG